MMLSQIHKPFFTGITIREPLDNLKRVNWLWFLIRLPMLLLAAPAAYGVSQFAREYLPGIWSVLAGASFESAYIGAIALADQQLEDAKIGFVNVTKLLWTVTNLVAVVSSILANLLFFAYGKYSNITPEIATHALPLPILGFVYGLLVHNYTHRLGAAHRKEINEKPYACLCSRRFATVKQLNGHKAQCKAAKI